MSNGVKTREYNSPRRRAQAAATRRDVLAAAKDLFERDGYVTTTMPAVASPLAPWAQPRIAGTSTVSALITSSRDGAAGKVVAICARGAPGLRRDERAREQCRRAKEPG